MEAIGLALMVVGVIGAIAQLWLLPVIFKDEENSATDRKLKKPQEPWRFEPPGQSDGSIVSSKRAKVKRHIAY